MMPDPRSSATSFVRPLDLRNRSLVWQVGAVLFGTLILALASWIEVPMVPVPMTMQTYAVVMIGAVYGWRLGGITTLVWLGEAAVGLPVLAGGSGGIAHFFGPTGGYLVAFPIIAAMVGWLTGRGWNGGRPLRAFAAMMLAHAICLGLGAAWLSLLIGFGPAVAHGVIPFIFGSILKSALAAGTLVAVSPRGRDRGRM